MNNLVVALKPVVTGKIVVIEHKKFMVIAGSAVRAMRFAIDQYNLYNPENKIEHPPMVNAIRWLEAKSASMKIKVKYYNEDKQPLK